MSLYKREGSEVWWINIRHAGRRVRESSGTVDRAEAQKAHNARQVELWTLLPTADSRTFGEAVELWTAARERSDQELLSLAKFVRVFGDRALSTITREDVHKALGFTVAPSTYMRYRAMVLSILNLASKEGWLDKVPDIATKADKKKKRKKWLTVEQWTALQAELPPHLHVMAEFAVETGLRQSNVLQLRWAQTSIERRVVWIEADEMKANVAHSVPLSDAALAVLEAQAGQHDEFVFTYQRKLAGKLVRAPIADVKTAFIKACVRAGLGTVTKTLDTAGKESTVYEGFTWHGFRHTWATWHVQNGTPLDVLQKLGGWASYSMVLVYAQHSPGYLTTFANNNRRAV